MQVHVTAHDRMFRDLTPAERIKRPQQMFAIEMDRDREEREFLATLADRAAKGNLIGGVRVA